MFGWIGRIILSELGWVGLGWVGLGACGRGGNMRVISDGSGRIELGRLRYRHDWRGYKPMWNAD